MKITIYECDKCHKRFEDDESQIGEVFGIADLCDKCFKKASDLFIDWLDGDNKQEDPEKVVEAEPKKVESDAPKKIDWNKACALKVAGWKNKDIADELGVESGTLNSGTFYKKLDQYKQGIRF